MLFELGFGKGCPTNHRTVISQKDSQYRLYEPIRSRHFIVECLTVDRDKNGAFLCPRRCHSRLIIDKRQFTKQSAGLNCAENDLFAFIHRLVDFDFAFLHNIGCTSRLSFPENDLISREDLPVHHLLVAVCYAH